MTDPKQYTIIDPADILVVVSPSRSEALEIARVWARRGKFSGDGWVDVHVLCEDGWEVTVVVTV